MNKQNLPKSDSFGEDQDKGTNSDKLHPQFDDSLLSKPETFINHIKELTDSNPFPVEVFPHPFFEFLKETNKALNFPLDYTGLATLVSVAAAIGKTAKIEVKDSWFEFPTIYGAIVGNPGSNKSHPITASFKPIEELDCAEIERFKLEYEAYIDLQKNEKQGKTKVDNPILSKTILHNFTPEALQERLKSNSRGCVIVSEELATFLEGMNNYSKSEQSSTFLSFWNNKPTSMDRVSKPVPLWIQEPFVNIIGSIQPRMLQQLFPVLKRNNGFIQRFLFAFPENSEKLPINDNQIDKAVLQNYSDWIKEYILKNPYSEAKVYKWSTEAKRFFYSWQHRNTAEVNRNQDSLLGEIISKFDIHFVRFCLILQIMEDAQNNLISLKAAEGAALLCQYFLRCAVNVLDILNKKNVRLSEDKINLFDALPETFSTREGFIISESLGFSQSTYNRFIAEEQLFQKLKTGLNKKRV